MTIQERTQAMKVKTKKRGLGRGLDALLGSVVQDIVTSTAPGQKELHELPIDVIRRGKFQPRSEINPERLEELADSIRAQGIVQPILVRPISATEYEIIAGERRWRAAQLVGLHQVPVVIKDVPDQTAMAMALIENIQRENLSPMDEAKALRRLIDEFSLTHQLAAEAVGRSRVAVSNLLRLFDLNQDVKEKLEQGALEMGHARALLGLTGDLQSEAARKVVSKGLSVRGTENLVRRLLSASVKSQKTTFSPMDPDTRKLQQELSERLGAGVIIQHTNKGKGKLIVHYNNLDELEGILQHIK